MHKLGNVSVPYSYLDCDSLCRNPQNLSWFNQYYIISLLLYIAHHLVLYIEFHVNPLSLSGMMNLIDWRTILSSGTLFGSHFGALHQALFNALNVHESWVNCIIYIQPVKSDRQAKRCILRWSMTFIPLAVDSPAKMRTIIPLLVD